MEFSLVELGAVCVAGPSGPNDLNSLSAAPLATGETQLWGLSEGIVYTAIRQAATGDSGDPLSQWGPWNIFEISTSGKNEPPTALPQSQGLLAADPRNPTTTGCTRSMRRPLILMSGIRLLPSNSARVRRLQLQR